jgi:membrane associated rhomboid family serine protease
MRPASVGFQCPDDVRMAAATVRAPLTIAGERVQNRPPLVAWGLIAANVVVYLITVFTSVDGINQPHASRLFQDWVLVPRQVALHDEYSRLFTSAFLHLSLIHIASNMLALYFIGPPLERLLGRWRFATVYVLSALGGGVAIYAFGSRYTPVAGASGAIFGLFAACLLFVRELGFDPRWLIGTLVINVVLTLSVPNISVLGHVGGFAVGVLASFAIAAVPWNRHRLPVLAQVGGFGGIAVALIVITTWRTIIL